MKREGGILILLLAVCAVVAAPSVSSAEGLQVVDLAEPVALAENVDAEPSPMVTLCHNPPGNPESAKTIVVDAAAAPTHLAHGDSLGACVPACAGVPSPVPKTGQTRCWDVHGNPIDCAGTGQDGEYQAGVLVDPRFKDNGDGTVTDHLTGLIWLRNASCFGKMNWTAALATANNLASGACGLTDGSVVGDWRMPNFRELQSLLDYDNVTPALPTGHPFTGVQFFYVYYMTSSTAASHPDGEWLVHFDGGAVNMGFKNSSWLLWPVRGGR